MAEIATAQRRVGLVERMANHYGVDPGKLLHVLKATAFKLPAKWDPETRRRESAVVSNEQMMALLVVAEKYQLNPFTKEIFAFPDKAGGVVPIVGLDGWSKIINSQDELDGVEFVESEDLINIDDYHHPAPAWIECRIYRKDRSRPTIIRERLAECYKPPVVGKDGKPFGGPWQTHPSRMLRHKSLIQCARVAFAFAGIYDEDEASRIIEGEVVRENAERSAETAQLNETLMSSIKETEEAEFAEIDDAADGEVETREHEEEVEADPAFELKPEVEKKSPPKKITSPNITLNYVISMLAKAGPDDLDTLLSMLDGVEEKDRETARALIETRKGELEGGS